MNVTLDHVDKLTKDIKTFWFKPPQPVNYIAGQYIEMKLPHHPVDERGDKHWFTLSSSPTEPLISITTRFSQPSSSFKATLAKLKPGDKIHISEPVGDFVLPKDKTRPIVFVVAGIGVTPARSMVKWLSDSSEQRKVQIIYAARSESDRVFHELFENYTTEISYVLSDAKPAGASKKLDANLIFSAVKNLNQKPLIYISGPEPLVESLTKDLGKNVDSNDIISDYFPGYTKV